MTAFTITVQDQAVQALLDRLARKAEDLQPALNMIGQDIIERAHQRFESSTGPDGTKWREHSDATVALLTARLAGHKSYRKKSGALNAAGQRRLSLRKLLVGQGEGHGMLGGLMGSFHADATKDGLTVGNSQIYAAIHQFGGTTGARSMIPGKTIPARPFLPVRQDGSLYPQESALIVDAINGFLADLQ